MVKGLDMGGLAGEGGLFFAPALLSFVVRAVSFL